MSSSSLGFPGPVYLTQSFHDLFVQNTPLIEYRQLRTDWKSVLAFIPSCISLSGRVSIYNELAVLEQ